MKTLDELLGELTKPFHPSAVTFKPGAVKENKAMALAYADLRAYQNRLDEVAGADWSVDYAPWGDKLICRLTICGVSRASTGEPSSQDERNETEGTSTEAQAFKRACAMFGLGRYLYNLPSVWVEYDAQKRRITDQAEKDLTQRYEAWLQRRKERLHVNGAK